MYEWDCAHMAWGLGVLWDRKGGTLEMEEFYLQGSSPAVWKWQIAADLVCGFWSGQKLPQVLAVPRLPVQSASVYLRPLDHWPATPVSFSVPPPQTAAPKIMGREECGAQFLAFLCFPVSLYEEILLHAVLSCFVFQFFCSLNFPLLCSWGDFLNCSLSHYWVFLSHSFGSLQQIGVCAVFCPLSLFF